MRNTHMKKADVQLIGTLLNTALICVNIFNVLVTPRFLDLMGLRLLVTLLYILEALLYLALIQRAIIVFSERSEIEQDNCSWKNYFGPMAYLVACTVRFFGLALYYPLAASWTSLLLGLLSAAIVLFAGIRTFIQMPVDDQIWDGYRKQMFKA